MNNKRGRLMVWAVVASLAGAPYVQADDTSDQINSLKNEIQALDQKVRVLERERELDTDSTATKAKETPRIVVGPSGLSVASADTNFVFSLHGVLQVDNRTFFGDHGIQGNDSFLLRRARPIFEGTVYRDFDFLFVPDFGGTSVQIFDAYMNYRYRPWLQFRAGKFKVPVGLEQLQSDRNTLFNERGLPTGLVPNRDIGFQLWGDIDEGTLSYAVGVFNGVGDARNTSNADFEDHRELAGRLFAQPFKTSSLEALQGLGLGVAGTWGNISSNATGLPSATGGTLGGYTTDGQQQFFAYNPTNGAVVANGTHWRISPQGYYSYGPLFVMGEYVLSDQGVSRTTSPRLSRDLHNSAWQVAGGWVLTGESASYSAAINPKHPFDPSAGHWGALQLVGRYAELDVDDDAFAGFSNPLTSASKAQAWSVGLNWYLNKNIRFATSYSHTSFTGGGKGSTGPGLVTRHPEQVLFTRLQLAF